MSTDFDIVYAKIFEELTKNGTFNNEPCGLEARRELALEMTKQTLANGIKPQHNIEDDPLVIKEIY
ncbi:MAG: hypothetical protein WC755_08960 [Candidatus Woesearchaeota archaeon]|jgi:hypothetical protein